MKPSPCRTCSSTTNGRERTVDYLGTEGSFTFSWGFQQTFVGLRAGMPHVASGPPATHWFPTEAIDAGTPPSADNWRTFDYPLEPYAGQTVCLVIKVSYGGPHGVCNDEAFFDEISVK